MERRGSGAPAWEQGALQLRAVQSQVSDLELALSDSKAEAQRNVRVAVSQEIAAREREHELALATLREELQL